MAGTSYPYERSGNWLDDVGGMARGGRYDVPSAAATFQVPLGASIAPDGSEDYRGLLLNVYLEAVSSAISDPKMVMSNDLTESNYYGAGGGNEPKLKNGSLLTTTSHYYEGFLVPFIDAGSYIWSFRQANVTVATKSTTMGADLAWVWLPGSVTSFNQFNFYRDSGGNFNDTCFVEWWFIK